MHDVYLYVFNPFRKGMYYIRVHMYSTFPVPTGVLYAMTKIT